MTDFPAQRLPRSALTAFDGERLPGIGHNQGPPLDTGHSWRKFSWAKARKELLPRLPLEVVKRRVARARELGLDYPQYASILLGTGRDIVGFLFTCDSLGMRLEKSVELPETIAQKLTGLKGCKQLLMADADPLTLAQALAREGQITFAGVARPPLAEATYAEGRTALRAALDPLKLPSNAVVMVGTRTRERDWADAAKLAKFLPAERYFTA